MSSPTQRRLRKDCLPFSTPTNTTEELREITPKQTPKGTSKKTLKREEEVSKTADSDLESEARRNAAQNREYQAKKRQNQKKYKRRMTIEEWELAVRKRTFKPRADDHLDEQGERLPPLIPTDLGFDPATMDTWAWSRKFNIVRYLTELFLKYRRHWRMHDFVESLRVYHKHTAERATRLKKSRKTSWLNSFQSSVSHFRRALKEQKVPWTLLRFVSMSREEKWTLEKEELARLEQASEKVPKINGEKLILRCRQLLTSYQPAPLLVALAALTGRRASEILVSGTFGPPRVAKKINSEYWASFSGVLKQREWDKQKVVSREIPLLETREKINEAQKRLRDMWPCTTAKEANLLYSSKASKCVKQLFQDVGKLHNFRKVYCPIAFEHFNDEWSYSLPRFASEVLTHKSIHGGRLLTYLNINVTHVSNINF